MGANEKPVNPLLQIPTVLRLAALAQEVGTLKITTTRSKRSLVILAIELWVQIKNEQPLVCRNAKSVEMCAVIEQFTQHDISATVVL